MNFDTGLSGAVKKLREALGDSAENPRFVETLPKRGYRFIAPLIPDEPATEAAPAADEPRQPTTPPQAPRPWQKTVVAGAAFVFLVAAVVVSGIHPGGWRDRLWHRIYPTPVRSIAVLPLENLTGDPAQDGIVAAITDSLTTELVRAGLLEVASRKSAAQFTDARIGVPEIARRLNVDGVVEGTVSPAGDRWLLNIQLIHGSSDRHLWAQQYERKRSEIAAFPRELAWEILGAIPPPRQPSERGEAHRRPANDEAYTAYVMGRHFLGPSASEIERAVDYFNQAIESDPLYGPAYSGLSDAYRRSTVWDPTPETLGRAEAAARKALELDGSLAEAHTSLGGVLWRHWKWKEAEVELRRALELDPDYAEGHRVYGVFLIMQRRGQQAAEALRRAHELDALSPTIGVEYASALAMTRRYDDARAELERVIETHPSFWRAYYVTSLVHAMRGDWNGAIDALERAPGHPANPAAYPWLAYSYAAVGRKAEALELLRNLEARADENEGFSTALGVAHLGLGDKERAFDLLEAGIRERPADVTLTAVLYDLLKDEPRYHAIVNEMGLRLPNDDPAAK